MSNMICPICGGNLAKEKMEPYLKCYNCETVIKPGNKNINEGTGGLIRRMSPEEIEIKKLIYKNNIKESSFKINIVSTILVASIVIGDIADHLDFSIISEIGLLIFSLLVLALVIICTIDIFKVRDEYNKFLISIGEPALGTKTYKKKKSDNF